VDVGGKGRFGLERQPKADQPVRVSQEDAAAFRAWIGRGSLPAGQTRWMRMAASTTRLDEATTMCRNIRTLFNFEPPATEEEIRAASLQFVRKLSGFNSPSKANQPAFERAVEDVAAAARALIGSLVTTADPRDREIEAARARARSAARFGDSSASR
jgi:hypothetical protein